MRKNPCVTCRELKLAGWVILLGGILTSASLGANPPATGSVTLVWDPSPDLAVVGYRLYEGLASSDYTVVIDVGNSTTGTASNLNFGSTYYFAVTDYDGTGEESPSSGEISYTVVVDAVHNGPVLPGQGNLTMAQYSTLLVTNTATDTDFPALALNYSLANPPVGAVISTNGVITWTPGPSQGHTTNLLTTVVTDAGVTPLSATNSFAVVVNEINVAPVLPAPADQALAGLQPLLVTNTASELDMPPVTLSYQLVGAPPTAAIDANGVITWTPAVADVPSTNVFTTVVTDNNPWAVNAQQLSATNSFTVMVNAIHNGPVLPGQGNLTMAQYTTLHVTNTATDTDVPALALNYSLVNPPTGAVISTNGVINWTPGPSQGHTTNLLTTVVTDAGVTPLSATNSFAVVVNEINVAPVLPAPADQALAGLQPLLVTNTASELDMPPVTLSYQLVGAPPTAAIDANGVITWTPAVADVPSTNVFTTVVTDNNPWAANAQQLSATNSFTVMVNLPAAPAPEIQSITVTDSLATITWASTPSRVYRLQCVDSLGSTNWQDLTLDVSAAAPTTAATDDVSGVASRFYRVQLVP